MIITCKRLIKNKKTTECDIATTGSHSVECQVMFSSICHLSQSDFLLVSRSYRDLFRFHIPDACGGGLPSVLCKSSRFLSGHLLDVIRDATRPALAKVTLQVQHSID